ncbi:Abi family protein (plasmid) [Paraburkholderia sp. FT54]|uniref:Abi family protein n=1 Tax=Paraburkholderia sp. FT54 TaxID=3074437 RepID=UPI002877E8C1|nr:Abi family protein [Paraburkholderia sp. FT54]WNC95574.1 Abi family protein [Paraburkholderia sp. FT54]
MNKPISHSPGISESSLARAVPTPPTIPPVEATDEAPAEKAAPPVTEQQLTAAMRALSQPRLDSYRSFFRMQKEVAPTDEELIGAYFWGQAIASALQPLVSTYEVVLRNAIHERASMLSSGQTSTSHPWYDHTRTDSLLTKGKSREKVIELLYQPSNGAGMPMRRAVQPLPDQVVASLSFGFWPAFLNDLPPIQRSQILAEVFPHYPKGSRKHWSFPDNVNQLIQVLKDIQDLRNRIAHHEPIWKPHRLTRTERHWWNSVQSIQNKHREIVDVLGWCCTDSAVLYKAGFGRRMFNELCTTHAVKKFMASPFSAGTITPFN